MTWDLEGSVAYGTGSLAVSVSVCLRMCKDDVGSIVCSLKYTDSPCKTLPNATRRQPSRCGWRDPHAFGLSSTCASVRCYVTCIRHTSGIHNNMMVSCILPSPLNSRFAAIHTRFAWRHLESAACVFMVTWRSINSSLSGASHQEAPGACAHPPTGWVVDMHRGHMDTDNNDV